MANQYKIVKTSHLKGRRLRPRNIKELLQLEDLSAEEIEELAKLHVDQWFAPLRGGIIIKRVA